MARERDPILQRIERGRQRLSLIAPTRDEAWEFYRGNHYAYVDENNVLQHKATVTSVRGRGKPRHRARQTRNLILDVVLHERSAATQRVPSYQITPSTTDPEDVGAARLAEKVAFYGYHAWDFRRVTDQAVMHAVVAGESFTWVYFDNTIGPFIGDEEGNVGLGDVRAKVFGANECFWEPGLRFEESPWHVVEHARPVEQVKSMDGYAGPKKLVADADSKALSSRGRGRGKPELVLVTEYLELPSAQHPEGRWITYANGERVVEDRDYPSDGQEPVLRRLSYAPDPDFDRDMGLVQHLLDPMRTYDDANNKAVEWKNLCLMPRIVVSPGLFKKQRWDDTPGKVYEIPQPDQNFKVVETPEVPQELFQIGDRAQADIARIAAQNDIPSQVEAGKAIEALIEKDAARRQAFVADLADWHGRVMHDALVQVQENYVEPRLLQIRGRFGPEPIDNFKGAQLRSQVDVRVAPDSIEPRTKQAIEQRLLTFAQAFPGVFPPEEIMSAINSGTAESLLESFELAKSRANSIIQKIKDGTFLSMGRRPVFPGEEHFVPVIGPDGAPVIGPDGLPQMELATDVPEWMPRPFDPIRVHKKQFEDWMQTTDWDALPPEGKEAGHLYYKTLLDLEAKEAEREAQMQQEMAVGLGMANAARPQGPSPMPSTPELDGHAAESAAP